MTETSSAADFENWDSINHVRLLISLERGFGFEFETEEAGGLETVGALIDLVEQKLKSA